MANKIVFLVTSIVTIIFATSIITFKVFEREQKECVCQSDYYEEFNLCDRALELCAEDASLWKNRAEQCRLILDEIMR